MKLYVYLVDIDNGGTQKVYDIIPNIKQSQLNGDKYSSRVGFHSGHPGLGKIYYTGKHFLTSNNKNQIWL